MREGYRELSFSAHRAEIKIEGFRIDRLLDKALAQGVCVRDFKMISVLSARCLITSADLKRLRRIAGPTYRITVMNRRGAAYRLREFFRVPLRVAGIALAAALVISQSFFVKTIQVSGYRGIPETLLRECLAEAGVKEGAYRPSIDWAKAQELIYDTFPQVTWLKLSYDGRKVFLDISEASAPIISQKGDGASQGVDGAAGDGASQGSDDAAGSDILTPSREMSGIAYSNIVAAQSGYVESASSLRGLLLAEEGDYVRQGQVLICGCVPLNPTYYDEDAPKAYYVRSKGEIWARVPYRLTFNVERYVREPEASDETVVSAREKTEEEAGLEAERLIRRWAKENLPENAEILNKSLKFSPKENIIELGVTLEVRRQIGEEQEILIGQESSDTAGDRQS